MELHTSEGRVRLVQPSNCRSEERTMSTEPTDLTFTFTVPQSPAEAFAAICDVRSWWSGDVEGPTDRLGAEWSYRVPDVHFSAFRITELVPDRSVAWLCTDSLLTFTVDQQEWTGTTVRFDVTPTAEGTRVRFTH